MGMPDTPHLISYLATAFCAWTSLVLLFFFLRSVRGRPDFPLVSSEWKGLGGGLGGLRLSTSLSYALLAAVFGILMVFILSQQITADRKRAENDFELQKARESETRKYEDAKQAREVDLEKARLARTAADSAVGSKRPVAPAAITK